MGVFDIKQIRPVVPTALYDKLRGEVRVGDYKAVSETNNGQAYLLAGLLGDELDRVLSSDDEIGQLTHALNNVNMMSHATMNGDIRQRQLILVLDETTRAFLETKVPSLIQPDVRWTIFRVDKNIDDDDNALAHASIVYQDDTDEKSDMVQVSYDGIADYLQTHGHVHEVKNDGLGVNKTPENPERLAERTREENDRHSVDTGVTVDGSLEDSKRDKEGVPVDLNDPDMKNQIFGDDDDPFGEDEGDVEEEHQGEDDGQVADEGLPGDTDDVEHTIGEFDPNKYHNDLDDDEGDPTEHTFISADRQSLPEVPGDSNDGDDGVHDDFGGGDDQVDDGPSLNFNTKTPVYTDIPAQLQDVLDSIKCPRLKLYTDTGVHTESIAKINQRIIDFNHYLDAKEQQLRLKVINSYQAEMKKALDVTNKNLNPETGDDTVTSRFKQDVTAKDAELDSDALARVERKRKELEASFMGEPFEQFKKNLLAQAEQLYRDKYYLSRVEQPLKTFKEDVDNDVKNKKANNRTDFYSWIGGLQTQAKESDMLNAIMNSRKLVEQEREKLLALSDDRQKELSKHDKELISLEYDERARASYNASRKRFDVDRAETDRLSQQIKDQDKEIRRLRTMYQKKTDEAEAAKWDATTMRGQLDNVQRRNAALENMAVSPVGYQQAPVPTQPQQAPAVGPTTQPSDTQSRSAVKAKGHHHFFKRPAVTNSDDDDATAKVEPYNRSFNQSAVTDSDDDNSLVTRQVTPDAKNGKSKKTLKSKAMIVAVCALFGLGGGVAIKSIVSPSTGNTAKSSGSSIAVESSPSTATTNASSSSSAVVKSSSASSVANGIQAPADGKYQEGQVLSGTVNGKKENLTVSKISGNKVYLKDSQNKQYSFIKK